MITVVKLGLIFYAVGIFLPFSTAYSSIINDYTMDFDMSFLEVGNRNDSSENAQAPQCPWREMSNGVAIVNPVDDQLQCADGSFCKGDPSDYGSDSWKCCNDKGGRVRCPQNHPNLCANKACGNETARCCEKDCNKPGENFGGNLPCPKKRSCLDCIQEFVEADMCAVCSDVDECFVFLPEGCNHCGNATYEYCNATDGTTEEWTEVAIKPLPQGKFGLSCPWVTGNTGANNTLECMDGYSCTADDTNHTDSSWQCCNEHGGRAKCPLNYPKMCASTQCGNGTAFCCEVDCAEYGGDRQCSVTLPPLPLPPYRPINCTGTDLPMDSPIFPFSNDTNTTCLATEACFCECSVNEDCPSNVCHKLPGPINPMTGRPTEGPGICAATKCSLHIDGNVNGTKDGMIDDEELALMKYQRNMNIPIPGMKEMLLAMNSTAFLGIARKMINLFDEDMDNVLSMSECANLYLPLFPSEMSRKAFNKQDLNSDGIINTTEIIRYYEDIGADPWTCCEEAAANCTLGTTEDCQKEALKNWFADELFPLANNVTGPVESVTIAEGVLSDLIAANEKRITTCGGCKWAL